tara:strand:+ start:101 stop:331 length:231 start_codon:yes stop_codon:yes gene_type:complete
MRFFQSFRTGAVNSPYSTLVGWLGFAVVALGAIQWHLDGDPSTQPDWNVVIAALLGAIGFTVTRDNAVNSRRAGAE